MLEGKAVSQRDPDCLEIRTNRKFLELRKFNCKLWGTGQEHLYGNCPGETRLVTVAAKPWEGTALVLWGFMGVYNN